MKKIIILLSVFLLVGCTGKKENPGNGQTTVDLSPLKEQLLKTAKEIFETDSWTKGGIRAETYTLTLKDLKENMYKDISMYKNPVTGNVCNETESKIEFIVAEQTEPDKTNYTLNVILKCD